MSVEPAAVEDVAAGLRGVGYLPGESTALVSFLAARLGKPVLVELVAPGCEACRRMDETLADADVRRALGAFEVVRLSVDQDPAWRLLEDLELAATPAFAIVAPDGTIGERRQGVQRAIQHDMAGTPGAPTAVWLPVFPSAAGFGAVMKQSAGGNRPERWFSQVPTDLGGIEGHKQLANKAIPALHALARTRLPSPEHVPTSDPAPVVEWMLEARSRSERVAIAGYASSITAAARSKDDRK